MKYFYDITTLLLQRCDKFLICCRMQIVAINLVNLFAITTTTQRAVIYISKNAVIPFRLTKEVSITLDNFW